MKLSFILQISVCLSAATLSQGSEINPALRGIRYSSSTSTLFQPASVNATEDKFEETREEEVHHIIETVVDNYVHHANELPHGHYDVAAETETEMEIEDIMVGLGGMVLALVATIRHCLCYSKDESLPAEEQVTVFSSEHMNYNTFTDAPKQGSKSVFYADNDGMIYNTSKMLYS